MKTEDKKCDLPSHAMPFQSKQVSCLWECWHPGNLLLWSHHQLFHAIKGSFFSVYKQILTGNKWLKWLDEIHDPWADLLQSETFFLCCPRMIILYPFYKNIGPHIGIKWHKALWTYMRNTKEDVFFPAGRVEWVMLCQSLWGYEQHFDPQNLSLQHVCWQETTLSPWKWCF